MVPVATVRVFPLFQLLLKISTLLPPMNQPVVLPMAAVPTSDGILLVVQAPASL